MVRVSINLRRKQCTSCGYYCELGSIVANCQFQQYQRGRAVIVNLCVWCVEDLYVGLKPITREGRQQHASRE